jgi:regulator of sigma E protease
MKFLLTIVALQVLLTLHELGHLAIARLFGMRASQVSLGFGPAVFTWSRRETEYVLRLVPLGAFFRIRGMNPYQSNLDPRDPGSFSSHAAWKRTLVVAAGSAANASIALAVLVCLYISGTHVPVPMTVGTVEPGSPAARSQIRPGDLISEIDGRPLRQWSSLVQVIADNPGSEVQLSIVRNGMGLQVTVRPQRDEQGFGRLGIAQQYVFRRHSAGLAARQSVAHVLHLAVEGTATAQRLLQGNSSREPLRQAAASAEQGWDGLLRAMVNLSLLMAAFFLLPFPGLDGGRLAFLLLELARGKPLPARVETAIHALGMLVLLGALVAIPIQRIVRRSSLQQVVPREVGAGLEGAAEAQEELDGGAEE